MGDDTNVIFIDKRATHLASLVTLIWSWTVLLLRMRGLICLWPTSTAPINFIATHSVANKHRYVGNRLFDRLDSVTQSNAFVSHISKWVYAVGKLSLNYALASIQFRLSIITDCLCIEKKDQFPVYLSFSHIGVAI